MSLYKTSASPNLVSANGASGDFFIEEFHALLSARTGLHIRVKDQDALAAQLAARRAALGMDARVYLALLERGDTQSVEWAHLMPLLTNGESYFERDRGQFALLRDTLLPELIAAKSAVGERVLRVWSAGCSTGEEAYSLAMAAQTVMPPGWKVRVWGTDINGAALQAARRGVYGEWSFRGVETTTRARFFRSAPGGFEPIPALRDAVTFEHCNLAASDWPDAARGLTDMDLIVCRNVLIYFDRAALAGVVARFGRTLRAGGLLLTGHAELHDQNPAPLRVRLFRESLVYQKDAATRPAPPVLAPRAIEAAPAPRELPTPTVPCPCKSADEWLADAGAHADAGRHEDAARCCRSALATDAAHVGAHLLWARVAIEQADFEQAKTLLRKGIYLAPSEAEAYAELGALYQREGNGARARQLWAHALELVRGTANDALETHLQALLSPATGHTLP